MGETGTFFMLLQQEKSRRELAEILACNEETARGRIRGLLLCPSHQGNPGSLGSSSQMYSVSVRGRKITGIAAGLFSDLPQLVCGYEPGCA